MAPIDQLLLALLLALLAIGSADVRGEVPPEVRNVIDRIHARQPSLSPEQMYQLLSEVPEEIRPVPNEQAPAPESPPSAESIQDSSDPSEPSDSGTDLSETDSDSELVSVAGTEDNDPENVAWLFQLRDLWTRDDYSIKFFQEIRDGIELFASDPNIVDYLRHCQSMHGARYLSQLRSKLTADLNDFEARDADSYAKLTDLAQFMRDIKRKSGRKAAKRLANRIFRYLESAQLLPDKATLQKEGGKEQFNGIYADNIENLCQGQSQQLGATLNELSAYVRLSDAVSGLFENDWLKINYMCGKVLNEATKETIRSLVYKVSTRKDFSELVSGFFGRQLGKLGSSSNPAA